MPIMPLRENMCENIDRNYDYGNRRRRKRRLSNDRSRSRSTHRHLSPRKYSNRSPKILNRRFRGSSGTRTRSIDREIRLKQYYHDQKQRESGYQGGYHHHCSGKRGGNRTDDSRSSYTCISARTSRSRTPPNNNHLPHHLHTSSGGGSCNFNEDANEKPVLVNDEDGHLVYRSGDWLRNRYKLYTLLGEGTFGKCHECYDRKHDRVVALKVIKNIAKYREAAKLEIEVLKKLSKKDPENKKFCIELLGYFNYGGHVCLVFPKLGKSVFDFMKENLYQPYPMSHVQHISYQLLVAVEFLHSIKLTHTDLKPENMLFVDSSYNTHWSDNARQDIHVLKRPDIQLIDFGSATFDHEHHSTIVSTRHYRAPEVVLELGWSQPCDVWSCGCIIFELFTGNTLFQTHDNREHLAMMERILGPLPKFMIKKSKKTKYFVGDALDWNVKSSAGEYVASNCQPLKDYLDSDRYLVDKLLDLLRKMLLYDPKERITAHESLKHSYFRDLDLRKIENRSSRR